MLSSGVRGVTLAAQYSHPPPLWEPEPTAAVELRPAGPPPTSAHVRERRTGGDMAGGQGGAPAPLQRIAGGPGGPGPGGAPPALPRPDGGGPGAPAPAPRRYGRPLGGGGLRLGGARRTPAPG